MTRDDGHDDFGGLQRDLHATGGAMDRRALLRLAAQLGVTIAALPLLGCEDTPTSPGASCNPRVPEETAGPFPGEGSNGPNVLNLSGVVRSDIRTSFAGLNGTATGVPLTIALTLISASTCAALAGRALYLWQCDQAGRYSLYSPGATTQNYLRGVQETDSSGKVTFTSIFPACYPGRWPHLHFEVYPSLAAATNVANKIVTSQIALPRAACDTVFATPGYEASMANLSGVTLATDMVFANGTALQLATVTGDVTNGMTATLTVGI